MLPARAAGARRSAYVLRALACSTSVMLSTGCSPSRSLSLSWTPVVSRRRRERLEGVSPSPRPAGYDTVYKRFAQGLGSLPPHPVLSIHGSHLPIRCGRFVLERA